VQFAQLELFCRRTEIDPKELVRLGRNQLTRKSRRFQDVVSDWVDLMRVQGRADSYIALNFAAVRSWLKFNDAAPQRRPSVVVRVGTKIENEQTPTAEE
jgi:hypothetical protein